MILHKKNRMTKQRQIILEELSKTKSHPTADEIYEMVRRHMPRISLGTIYRNLEILSENNIIMKLDMSGSQMRFDGNADNHYHVRCTMCESIYDLPTKPIDEINHISRDIKDFDINGYRLEFYGICTKCKQIINNKENNTYNKRKGIQIES